MTDIAANHSGKLTARFWSKLVEPEKEFISEAYTNSVDSQLVRSRRLQLSQDVIHRIEKMAASDIHRYILLLAVFKSTYSRFFTRPEVIVFSNTFSKLTHLGQVVFCKTTISQETTPQQMLLHLADHFSELLNMGSFNVWQYLSEKKLNGDDEVSVNHFNLVMTYGEKQSESLFTRFFLLLNVVQASDREYHLEFRSPMDPGLLEQFVMSFEMMLTSFTNEITTPVVRLNMISTEQEAVVLGFASEHLAVRADKSVMQMFDESVSMYPQRQAVVSRGKTFTYEALGASVNRLSNFLVTRLKSGKGERIGVSLSRSHKSILAMLAVFKTGACYVPLDRTLPAARLKYLIEDVQPALLVVEDATQDIFAPYGIEMVNLDTIDTEGVSSSFSLPAYYPEADAYIVYTSGSTGQPKGIRQTYKTLSNLTEWQIRCSGIESGLSFLQYASFTFDVSIQDAWFVLASGGELHVTDDDIRLKFEALKEYILANGIEVFFFPYSVLGNFFNANDAAKLKGNKLRHIISGSEQVFIGDGLEAFLRQNPAIKLHNQYGPSETHVVTSFTLDASGIIKRVPIGKPIANTRIYILDENLRPAPIGVIGEIYVAGYNLANGYWNLPKNTSETFLQLEIGGKQERVYRTGDFAKWHHDGNIAYLGRGDDQVKIRGFRIELSEISKFILRQPGVKESVVVTYEDRTGQKQIAAFVIPGDTFDLINIEKELRSHFPDYMVPHHIITMDRFPLTPNGKLDKKKLQGEIDSVHADLVRASFGEPASRLEEDLLALWRTILNNDAIGTNADFFRFGGDSMLAIRLVGKIKSQLGLPVEAKDLYHFPTVSLLAKKIAELGSSVAGTNNHFDSAMAELKEMIIREDAERKLLPEHYEDFYPIADIQFGMLFHSWKEAELSLYHDQNIVYIDDPEFDPDTFRKALQMVVEKHAILRTSFMIEQFSVPIQVVHPYSAEQSRINLVDLSALAETEKESHLLTYVQNDLSNKFDVSRPGVFRLTVFRLTARTYGILLVNHHAILDGWSYASLMTELSNLYFSLKADSNFSVRKLKTDYKAFVRSQLENALNDQVKDFWKQSLAGYERTPLPFHAKPTAAATCVESTPIMLNDDLQHAIKRYSETSGYSYKEIFLAAFLFVVRWTTNSKEVTIGLVSNARHEDEESDQVLGCFLNTIPFRLLSEADIAGSALVQKVHDELRCVKAYDKLSLNEIAKVCGHVSINQNPFYDIMFDYVDFHIYKNLHKATAVLDTKINLGNERPNGILQLQVQNHSGDFRPWWIYRNNVFSSEAMSKLSHYIGAALEQITAYAAAKLDTDHMLTKAERHALESLAFSQLSVSYPGNWTLIDAFNKSVREHPQGIALRFGNKSLTYVQLDELSDRVAVYLQDDHSIRANDFVGLLMNRSEMLIIGMLGILKSGAAYIPIDPKYPQERKDYILEKSSLRIIISNLDRSADLCGFDQTRILDIATLLEKDVTTVKKPQQQNKPDDLAYIIFTSGSSGKPKGVKVTHRNVVRLFVNDRSPFEFSPNDCWLCFHSVCFDFSVWEIFGPLTSGGTLVLASNEEIYNIDDFLNLLVDQKITVLSQTPTAFSNWAPETLQRPHLRHHQVRYIVFGGEALNPSILANWKKFSPGTKLINMYGITETTVHVTYKEVLSHEIDRGVTTAGKPLPTLGVLILDDQGRMVPKGTIGEIAVAGLGVASGYLNDEDLTSRKFVRSRYLQNGLCYLSGDMARILDNNEIEYIGRKDSQVKIRGYRIELQEIEIPLNNHPEIEMAKVVPVDKDGHKLLVAYYISSTGRDVNQLFAYLRQHIPGYMIPSKYIRVDKFRFNENGKLDIRYLHETPTNGLEPKRAPATALEIVLGQLWKELLGVPIVGADDNFFEIGGNSLKAAQLVLKVKQLTGRTFTIREAFEFPTLAQQADLLDARNEAHAVLEDNANEITSFTL